MPNEFEKIKDLAGWRTKLDELLETARDAARNDALEVRLTAAERLTQFIVHNPAAFDDDPASAEYEDMDNIAKKAHDALMEATVQARVASVMTQTAELALLRKKVQSRAASNFESAAGIRLEKARKVVDATTACVAAIIELKTQIGSGNRIGADSTEWIALGKQLETSINSLQSLRSEVETLL